MMSLKGNVLFVTRPAEYPTAEKQERDFAMNSFMIRALKRASAALGLCVGLLGSAQAGLVSGTWDPAFGGTVLPNLSWRASFNALIPNSCSALADGDYLTTNPACDASSISFQQIRLYLFDTNTAPSGYFELGPFAWNVASVRVKNQQIIGINTGSSPVNELTYSAFCDTPGPSGCVHFTYFSNPPSALGNLFDLQFTLNGAKLTCLHCRDSFSNMPPPPTNFDLPNIDSSTDNLVQFLVTYTDNAGTTPKFTDPNGAALGARLDGVGTYLGQSTSVSASLVPEPGALALVCVALAGLFASPRRRLAQVVSDAADPAAGARFWGQARTAVRPSLAEVS